MYLVCSFLVDWALIKFSPSCPFLYAALPVVESLIEVRGMHCFVVCTLPHPYTAQHLHNPGAGNYTLPRVRFGAI